MINSYIFRIDNGLEYMPNNEDAPYRKFCEINKLIPEENRFGWFNTGEYYFKSILSRKIDESNVSFKLYKIREDSKFMCHDFDEYQTFMYYLEEFGEVDKYFDTDEERCTILNNTSTELTNNSLIQVIFNPNTVDEVYSTNCLDKYMEKIKQLNLLDKLTCC